tara:strand:- start:255 stop:593 length:339 start_codon:yes stop_codon:yes gene_type:complete
MSRTSVNLLSSTATASVTGDKVPGDSFYGFTDGVHTFAIYPNNFTGSVEIQATLATEPTDNDWFKLQLKDGDKADYTAQTVVDAYTFTGNFLYLRAVVTLNSGSIDKILMNY